MTDENMIHYKKVFNDSHITYILKNVYTADLQWGKNVFDIW